MPTSSSLTPPPKKAEELESIAGLKSSSGEKKLNTKNIMIGLARAQHKIPKTVPDDDSILKAIVLIEKRAIKLRSAKQGNIDKTLRDINEAISRIGTAGTRPAVQLQNKYTQEVGMIKGDFSQIAQKQDEFHRTIKSSLQNKDQILNQVSEALAQGKEPDKQQLKKIETSFQELSQKAEKLTIEEERFDDKLKALKTEVTQTAEAVSGPIIEEGLKGPE